MLAASFADGSHELWGKEAHFQTSVMLFLWWGQMTLVSLGQRKTM